MKAVEKSFKAITGSYKYSDVMKVTSDVIMKIEESRQDKIKRGEMIFMVNKSSSFQDLCKKMEEACNMEIPEDISKTQGNKISGERIFIIVVGGECDSVGDELASRANLFNIDLSTFSEIYEDLIQSATGEVKKLFVNIKCSLLKRGFDDFLSNQDRFDCVMSLPHGVGSYLRHFLESIPSCFLDDVVICEILDEDEESELNNLSPEFSAITLKAYTNSADVAVRIASDLFEPERLK